MRSYDLVLVLEPNATEADRKKLTESVKKWLGDGKLEKVNDWGKKAFVRPLKKLSEGFYSVFKISTEVIPNDLEKKIVMEGKVLRHLLIRKD